MEDTGTLYIFRRAFVVQMNEESAEVMDIVAYIGDLACVTKQYWIVVRKKLGHIEIYYRIAKSKGIKAGVQYIRLYQ